MQDSERKPCPECGGRRVRVSYYLNGYVMLQQRERSVSLFSGKKKNYSETAGITCINCGLTTIYALTPDNLIPDGEVTTENPA